MTAKQPTDAELIAQARAMYASDVEIDDDAVVSRGDDWGVYVQAWVWVPYPEPEGDK